MMSPDGKAARFIVTHEGNAMGPEGIEHVEQFPDAIKISAEGDLVGRREDLHRRRGIQQQGHQGPTPLPICSSWRSPRSC